MVEQDKVFCKGAEGESCFQGNVSGANLVSVIVTGA